MSFRCELRCRTSAMHFRGTSVRPVLKRAVMQRQHRTSRQYALSRSHQLSSVTFRRAVKTRLERQQTIACKRNSSTYRRPKTARRRLSRHCPVQSKQATARSAWTVLEASTGIEPVYTDLQSAASPLRQLASRGVSDAIAYPTHPCKTGPHAFCRVAPMGNVWHTCEQQSLNG